MYLNVFDTSKGHSDIHYVPQYVFVPQAFNSVTSIDLYIIRSGNIYFYFNNF